MTNAETLLIALLALFRPSGPARQCIEENRVAITQKANQAETEYGVPAGVILTVAFYETHIGCTFGRGNANWGAPISRTRRNVHGNAFHAASSLRRSFQICGTWQGAINRFRCGLCSCNPERIIGYTPGYAVRQINRLYRRANIPVPENFRRRNRSR